MGSQQGEEFLPCQDKKVIVWFVQPSQVGASHKASTLGISILASDFNGMANVARSSARVCLCKQVRNHNSV